MQMAAIGTGLDLAGLPLPDRPLPDLPWRAPAGDRPAMTAFVTASGDLVVDEWCDPVVARIGAVVAGTSAATARTAAADQDLVAAYLWGAAELASRVHGTTALRERREWGAREMLTELALALRLPEGTLAHRLARLARLATLPGLRAANLSGLVSSWHVDAVLDVLRAVTDPALLARADAFLAERATRMTAPELRACARGWRARHVPRTDEQRRANLDTRRVDITPADDDLCFLTALIPAAQAMAIDHRLDQCAAAAVGTGDERTRTQVRADVLVDLLLSPGGLTLPAPDEDGASGRSTAGADDLPSGGPGVRNDDSSGQAVPGWVLGIRPEVVLTVPVLALLGHSDEPAHLEGFGPIDLETARLLAAHAPSFIRVLTHPETGAVLSVGRDRYRLPEDLRRAVRLRDRTCRFPGCRRPARGCDIDHSRAWAAGGGSELCNLECLCRKHHRLKHEMRWTVTHESNGTLRWHSPIGLSYWTEPGGTWPARPAPPPTAEPPPGPSPILVGASHASSGYPAEPPF